MSDQRENILGCACELYLREGFDGFSMRKLARTLGVTAPAIYRHFESKDEVLLSVVEEAYKVFAQYLYRSLSGPTPTERFRRAGREYLSFALENHRLYEMLFVAPSVLGMEEFPPHVMERHCAIGQFWMDRVREAMDSGLLREGDPQEFGRTMWAHSHGLIALYFRGMLDMDEEGFRTFYQESGARVLQGLAQDGWVAEEALAFESGAA